MFWVWVTLAILMFVAHTPWVAVVFILFAFLDADELHPKKDCR